MSDDWLGSRFDEELALKQIRALSSKGYERWLMIVDDSGKAINITKLDKNAKAQGNVKI